MSNYSYASKKNIITECKYLKNENCYPFYLFLNPGRLVSPMQLELKLTHINLRKGEPLYEK